MAKTIFNSLLYDGHYVDDMMQPLETFSDLRNLPTTKLFYGLNVLVENNNLSVVFQYHSKISKNRFNWVIKELPVFPTYEELTATTIEIVSRLGSKSKAFYVGLEATVQVGANGGIEKYVVTEVINGLPTWTLIECNNTNMSTGPSVVIDMINNDALGNVVYLTEPIYSYETTGTGGEIIVVYTENQSEAEGKPGYTEYPEALYVITSDSNGNTVLSDVIVHNNADGTTIKVIGNDIEE